MDDDKDRQRIVRYVMGQCAPDERLEIGAWVEADEGRARLVADLEWVWEALGRHRTRSRVDRAWQQVMTARAARVAQVGARPAAAPPKRPFDDLLRTRSIRQWLVQAAAAALVVGAAGAALWYSRSSPPTLPSPGAAASMHEVATPRGQRATLRLADGTRVMLNADTRLRYPRNFGGSGRDVYLEGEAYFEVAHDSNRPFSVHTPRGVARDLGTTFTVRAYAESPTVDVVVAEGSVLLRAPASGADAASTAAPPAVLLTASMLGSIDAKGRLSVRKGIDPSDHLAWTEGRLVFVETPLRDVIPRLSRWYDIDIRMADSALAGIPFTASVTGASPESVVRLLAASVEAGLERRGTAYVLYPKARSGGPAPTRSAQESR
jgi:transmembrane sensor